MIILPRKENKETIKIMEERKGNTEKKKTERGENRGDGKITQQRKRIVSKKQKPHLRRKKKTYERNTTKRRSCPQRKKGVAFPEVTKTKVTGREEEGKKKKKKKKNIE